MSKKPKGYMGALLYVNLSSGEFYKEELNEQELRMYIGGAGLGAKILYDNTTIATDPLSPNNILIFMTGPFTNTIIPGTSRHAVVSKSPLTGLYGESDSGGTWGATLKRAGFDGVVIFGAADRPVYLYIHDGRVEIRPADHLWGMDTYEVDDVLKAETSRRAVVCAIGPAGERLVKIAAVMNDGKHGRAAARCGLGAVMGSKKLKAIVVEGNQKTEVVDFDKLRQSLKQPRERISQLTAGMRRYGTSGGIRTIEEIGDLPIKNWRKGAWPDVAKVSGIAMADSILVQNYGCGNCVIKCGRTVRVDSPNFQVATSAGPEYETVASFGSLCLIDNLEAIAKANELCNRLGLDTISTGAAIAFAIEAAEIGMLSKNEVKDLALQWGNIPAILSLIEQIGLRTGLGELLGRGVKEAAAYFGSGAEDIALHVKGLELPMHDPRAHNCLAVTYATSPRGACHLQGMPHILERSVKMPELGYEEIQDRFGISGKGIMTAKMQNLCALLDALKLCKFTLFGGLKISEVAEWLNCVTGWQVTPEEIMLAGERMFNLKRMYNVRLGIRYVDDNLPKRILTEPRGEGGAATNLPPLETMLAEYYNFRGWDSDGVPLSRTLQRLGIT